MCLICIDIDRNVLTSREARRNLSEMCYSLELNHLKVVQNKIADLVDQEIREYEQFEDDDCEICGCESCECDWRHC